MLLAEPRQWLITGVAGFIGSHLLEALLRLQQRVSGLDDLSTGSTRNLDAVRRRVSAAQWDRFTFYRGNVVDLSVCRKAAFDCDYVLHQAGFVSVPLSIADPVACHQINATGTLNLLIAASDHQVRRFVFASSSAVYGDDTAIVKVEGMVGSPLSPYALSKSVAEGYARLFTDRYGLETVGLRYFNIFGTRQNPLGGYAPVIPQWISRCVAGGQCVINGDAGITRDFCHVADVVQANLLAATRPRGPKAAQVFNVARGATTTLGDLHASICRKVSKHTGRSVPQAQRAGPRMGDIMRSAADISLIQRELGFAPTTSLEEGLDELVRSYAAAHRADFQEQTIEQATQCGRFSGHFSGTRHPHQHANA
jgi:UDP-N-acetylglucosamine 4-epimerase